MANNRNYTREDTFDAGQFGTLRYDFKKFGGVQGLIPDPSDELIEQYMRAMRDIAREFGHDEHTNEDLERMSAEELAELMADDAALRIADAQGAMCQALSELCQGSPDTESLLALPLRVRTAFSQWLQRKLLDPESSAVGGSPVRAVRSGG